MLQIPSLVISALLALQAPHIEQNFESFDDGDDQEEVTCENIQAKIASYQTLVGLIHDNNLRVHRVSEQAFQLLGESIKKWEGQVVRVNKGASDPHFQMADFVKDVIEKHDSAHTRNELLMVQVLEKLPECLATKTEEKTRHRLQ